MPSSCWLTNWLQLSRYAFHQSSAIHSFIHFSKCSRLATAAAASKQASKQASIPDRRLDSAMIEMHSFSCLSAILLAAAADDS